MSIKNNQISPVVEGDTEYVFAIVYDWSHYLSHNLEFQNEMSDFNDLYVYLLMR